MTADRVPGWHTVSEAASALGVSRQYVHQMLLWREFPAREMRRLPGMTLISAAGIRALGCIRAARRNYTRRV